ncbi:MAG: SDR family NAD(P)-dependent oxidoreductase [Chloroflexota bacterium]
MGELQDKVAIITGGTGGLGGAVVATMLQAGSSVFVTYQREADFDQLRAQLADVDTTALRGAMVDLVSEASVEECYNSVGNIDILINIAGGFGGGQKVHETPWSLWQEQLDINLKTAVLSCRFAVPHILARGGGAIVNVGTRTIMQSGAYVAAYGASKRAVMGLTEALSAELLDDNITANAVLPSVIDTPANRSANPDADYSTWVQPADIAQVIRFLVGPHSRIISGAAIPVYGRA